jgi:hypothetical protein
MAIGDSVTPQINPIGDIDFFTFTGMAGDSLNFLVKAHDIGSDLYPYLVLYDSTGMNYLSSWSGLDLNIMNYRLPYGGKYYCQISNNGPTFTSENMSYIFRIDAAGSLHTGSLSGTVYMDNMETLYNGQGYYIYVYDSKTLNNITSIYSQKSLYQINNIPAGTYKINIDASSDPLYLSEWFDNAPTSDIADNIVVTGNDTVKNVNFILDRGGNIAGRIFQDNLSTDYTSAGSLYLYMEGQLNSIFSYYVPANDEGLYLVSGLQPGQYKIGFTPNYPLSNEYPTVWYNQVGAPLQGMSVNITQGDTTENINFILRQGGRIQGFVHLPDGMTPLGNDSLSVDLVLYDPLSGNLIGDVLENTFSAGYRTQLLFPGPYKFQALSQVSTLASWYYEDGNQFEDNFTMNIDVESGGVHEVNITLASGAGSISGVVYEKDGSTPTERPGRIFAYDASGHIVQSTVIGIDAASNELLDTGHYHLTGLKNGTYFLMLTFDFIEQQLIINKNKTGKNSADDNMNNILLDRIRPNFLKMKQVWYGEVVVDVGYVLYPHFQTIPDGAVSVSVTEPNDTPNIDFYDLSTAIELSDVQTIPNTFGLESIYPNPFNPSTTIRYALPSAGPVNIEIFDILGRKVATLFEQKQNAGWHTVQWNGYNEQHQAVTSGIYIARLKAGDKISTKKMILLR